MTPRLTYKTTLAHLQEVLPKESDEHKFVAEQLEEAIELTGIQERDIKDVEIEVTEQYHTIMGFTIWTQDTIITTTRWTWLHGDEQYIGSYPSFQVIPVNPYDTTDFEYGTKESLHHE